MITAAEITAKSCVKATSDLSLHNVKAPSIFKRNITLHIVMFCVDN